MTDHIPAEHPLDPGVTIRLRNWLDSGYAEPYAIETFRDDLRTLLAGHERSNHTTTRLEHRARTAETCLDNYAAALNAIAELIDDSGPNCVARGPLDAILTAIPSDPDPAARAAIPQDGPQRGPGSGEPFGIRIGPEGAIATGRSEPTAPDLGVRHNPEACADTFPDNETEQQ